MKDINNLKKITNTSTWRFILFNIVTLCLYSTLWGYKNTDKFNEEFGFKVINTNYFIYIWIPNALSLCYLTIYAFLYGPLATSMSAEVYYIQKANCILSFIFVLYWSFTMRSSLIKYTAEHFGIKLKISRICTFFFNYYYINYCMNALEKKYLKQQSKSEKS